MIREAFLSEALIKMIVVRQEPVEETTDDLQLVELLRDGHEGAFDVLVERYQATMLRLATMYVGGRAVAEEVVQETWMGVLQGLHRFEGRSSPKTWIFRILINRAKTQASREERYIPFSAFDAVEGMSVEISSELEAYVPLEQRGTGHWTSFSSHWQGIPEEGILSQEVGACIDAAIATLPSSQRAVINLRDREGRMADEICSLLGISEVNQRVLLHRARARVRVALEKYFAEE